MKSGRLATWLALSALAHGVAVGGYVEYKQRPLRNLMASWFEKKEKKQDAQVRGKLQEAAASQPQKSSEQSQKERLKEEIRREREALIHKARQQLKEGKLELGEFILQADYLDAKEEGKPFDLKEAREKYLAYLDKLKKELIHGKKVYDAVPDVLKDLDYYNASKRMVDILFEGTGRCETLSLLVSSLVYDSGRKNDARIRKYSDHLAPIFSQRGKEYDLSAGAFSYRKGVLFRADRIIEMYPLEGGFIYPHTNDKFKGIVPLFAKNAIKRFDPRKRLGQHEVRKCEDLDNQLKLVLAPIHSLPQGWSAESMHTTPLKIPDEEELGRLCMAIEHEKSCLNNAQEKPGKLVHLARLVAFYETARWNLRLIGRFNIADAAEDERKKHLAAAFELIDRSETDQLAKQLRQNQNMQFLIYLGPKGEDLLFKAVGEVFTEFKGRLFYEIIKKSNNLYGHRFQNPLIALGMLVSNPSSKEKAIEFAEEHFSKTELLAFMRILHLFNLPFLRNEEFDRTGTHEFLRVFGAYENIDKRYRPPQWHFIYRDPSMKPLRFDRLFEIITDELQRAQLSKDWERAFVKYYAFSMFSTDPTDVNDYDSSRNPEALDFLKALSEWLNQNPHSEFEDLKKIVGYIVAKGRYDVETLKEARKLVGID